MEKGNWFQLGQNPWGNGLRLAVLNAALAVFCIISFLGLLEATVLLSTWLMSARGGDPSAMVPFPFPVLLLLYAALFLITWFRFGRRLAGTRRDKCQAAVIGALPLFGLSLLGYASAVWMFVFGNFNAHQMLAASVFIYTIISTLILFAGLICIWLVGLRFQATAVERSTCPTKHSADT